MLRHCLALGEDLKMSNKNKAGDDGVPKKKRKTIAKQKVCYKCGVKVHPEAPECPECGATGDTSPLWLLKITIGFILGFVLWLMFWR